MIAIFAILVGCTTMVAATDDIDQQFHSRLDTFSKNIFTELYKTNSKKNIIISPFSIQTCLAMVRLGADGQTAIEMDQGLSFVGQSAESVADNYHTLLGKYEDGKLLKIANKVYIMKGNELQDKYNEVLSQKYYTTAENMDFSQSIKAAEAINSWIELKTDKTITDLIKPDTLNADTSLLLLSAIYFKGDWLKPFDAKKTEESDFYTDENQSVKVQMMFRQGMITHSRLDELDATAVRLPYKDSDLSMVIILPNSRTGLSAMQEKLYNFNLASVSEKLQRVRGVRLYLPKFKANFEINLREALEKVGTCVLFVFFFFGSIVIHLKQDPVHLLCSF